MMYWLLKKNVLFVILLVLTIFQVVTFCDGKQTVSIGVLLNSLDTQVELPLNSTLSRINLDKKSTVILSENVKRISQSDIFDTAETFCKMIGNRGGLQAVIENFETTLSIPLLESACKNFHIPFLTTSWHEYASTESDYFINFYPESGLLAKAIAEIVKSLGWKGYILFYETEHYLIQLQEVLKLKSPSFMKVVQLGEGPDYRTILKNHKNSTETNIILACDTELIMPILMQARDIGMLNVNYRYFLTSFDAHTLDFSDLNTTSNITTLRLFDPNSDAIVNTVMLWEITEFEYSNRIEKVDPYSIKVQTALFYDALLYLTDAVKSYASYSFINNNILSCNQSDTFQSGFGIASAIKSVKLDEAITSPIKFDSDGNRIDFNIYVYDVLDEELIATWYQSNESIVLSRTENETDFASISNLKKVTVIVSTKLGEPYLREVAPREDGEELEDNDRYEGYSKDLMDEIADIIGFKYKFKVSSVGYSKWDDQKKRWTGLIGDVLEKRAQLAICDLTITRERSEVVDFSMPFMTLGISILHKHPGEKDPNMFAFLDPFAPAVWIYSATLYLVMSILLYFIARMTPGDWENPNPADENPEELENIWDLKNCHWVTLASIMNQGCDILPKGISSRLALSMWWFFALIITNSYIANLTAFLTKAGLEPAITSVEALSKQSKIKYGLVEGGSTDTFFRTSNLSMYERMYNNMLRWRPKVFEKENKDGVARVKNDNNANYAFLMESTQIEYEIERDCELKQVGNWLDTKSYGIAMPLNAAYRPAINKAVLHLQETGRLIELKTKWWKNPDKEKTCNRKETSEEEGLKFSNVGGVFVVLGSGTGIAVILALISFLWNVRDISVEEHLSYWETLKLELKFGCNIFITKKRIKPPVKSSPASSVKSGKGNSTFYLNKI